MLTLSFPELEINETYSVLAQKFPLVPVDSEQHHESALQVLESIIIAKMDTGLGIDEKSGLNQYFKTLSLLVKDYEDSRFKTSRVSQGEILSYLLESNGLTQADLQKEIGAQPMVSRIIRGERELTPKHIRNLCKRFNLSADVFISND